MGANRPDILDALTIQATLSFWSNTPAARAFVKEWLGYCLNFEAIRDATPAEMAGEDAAFIEHRHDQAILTNLASLHDAPVLDVATATLEFAKSASMIELDLRARDNWFYACLYGAITGAARLRRRLAMRAG